MIERLKNILNLKLDDIFVEVIAGLIVALIISLATLVAKKFDIGATMVTLRKLLNFRIKIYVILLLLIAWSLIQHYFIRTQVPTPSYANYYRVQLDTLEKREKIFNNTIIGSYNFKEICELLGADNGTQDFDVFLELRDSLENGSKLKWHDSDGRPVNTFDSNYISQLQHCNLIKLERGRDTTYYLTQFGNTFNIIYNKFLLNRREIMNLKVRRNTDSLRTKS